MSGGLLHRDHRLIGRRVTDSATGRTGILRAIAPDGDNPKPVAWIRPEGGGVEWTTAPGSVQVAGPVTPDTHPKRTRHQQ